GPALGPRTAHSSSRRRLRGLPRDRRAETQRAFSAKGPRRRARRWSGGSPRSGQAHQILGPVEVVEHGIVLDLDGPAPCLHLGPREQGARCVGGIEVAQRTGDLRWIDDGVPASPVPLWLPDGGRVFARG